MPIDGFGGRLVRPDDPAYDETRAVFNRSVDRRPALLALCASPGDVSLALQHARDRGLPVSVRAGGHNFAGHAVLDGGVVIDLRPLRAVAVDPVERTVHVQAGLVWADVDARTRAHGLACAGGSVSTVGVAGFSLGTGLGWLGRAHGLAGDSLLGAEMVTADGVLRVVDAERDPELFWALRGGCGNFGVVTRFRFRAHPVDTVLGGSVIVPLAGAAAALRAVLDATASAPDLLNWSAVLVMAPPDPALPPAVRGEPVLLLAVCALGDDERCAAAVERLLSRVRAAAPVAHAAIAPVAFATWQGTADASAPEGACWDVRSEWLTGLDDAGVQAAVEAAADIASPLHEIVFRPLGGAVAAAEPASTPFGWRDAALLVEVIAGWEQQDPRGQHHREWMLRTWEALRPWSAGGPDVSHLGVGEGADRVRAAYSPAAYDRLVAVKRAADPDDVFRSTQHIAPVPAGARS